MQFRAQLWKAKLKHLQYDCRGCSEGIELHLEPTSTYFRTCRNLAGTCPELAPERARPNPGTSQQLQLLRKVPRNLPQALPQSAPKLISPEDFRAHPVGE